MGKNKKRLVIFGAGKSGLKLLDKYRGINDTEVVAFADNFKTGWIENLPILKPEELRCFDYDNLVIASVATEAIKEKLLQLGVSSVKILDSYVEVSAWARDTFLKNLAQEIARRKILGSTAEAGVFQGDFAKLINHYFPERRLYLFDTFVGFDERDIAYETHYNADYAAHFRETSVELVMGKMEFPERVILKKGHIPETLQGITDNFCFVNLDMDLYRPTLVALEWFWPRMVSGGIILVHDFFEEAGIFPHLREAVIQFAGEHRITMLPIGDDLSVALCK